MESIKASLLRVSKDRLRERIIELGLGRYGSLQYFEH
jgi:hypothetical protein